MVPFKVVYLKNRWTIGNVMFLLQVWTVNGDQRVGVFTLREIEKNEELTFNYNLETLG